MDAISTLAFHPVKMQACYQKVEQLRLEGLQQRFDVSGPAVLVQRAQVLMRQASRGTDGGGGGADGNAPLLTS